MPMNKSRQPKLLDIVAVLNPPADAELEVGETLGDAKAASGIGRRSGQPQTQRTG
jgi:hypothetical protein